MERRNEEPTLLDGWTAELGGPRTMDFLAKVDRVVDWEALAATVRPDVAPAQPQGGRPFLPVGLMIKGLMLAKWFGLSDPQLEELLLDRLSFRRWVGLGLNDPTPDETSFVHFRQRLRETGHASTLFEAVLAQLKARGLVLQEGSLVDATIVEAPKGGQNKDGDSTRDRGASFTQKHGRSYHGYKAHVKVSRDRLITDYVFDTARVHDSRHIDPLIEGETKAVYADSAYMDQARQRRLEQAGVICGIVQRRVRGQQALTPAQQAHNRLCAKVRALVEHPFAWMKGPMRYLKARYRGLSRNGMDFGLTAAAYNLKRSLSLLGMALTPVRAPAN